MFNPLKMGCAEKITAASLALNIVIFIIKTVSAYFSKSSAMLAESMHTLSDIGITMAVLTGIIFSLKAEKEERHQRAKQIEADLSRMLATVLMVTAFCITLNGVKVIVRGSSPVATRGAVTAIILSALIKEIMYRYTFKAYIETKNCTLKADAWHHRSDALSSIATLVGIIGARMGIAFLDPAASVIVSIMIMKTAVDIYKTAYDGNLVGEEAAAV